MTKNYLRALSASLTLLVVFSVAGLAQTDDTTELRSKAFKLIAEQKFTDALPFLEKIAAAAPNDPDVQRNLGFALLGHAKNTADAAAAKQLRARSHAAFVAARKAGDTSPLVAGL